MNLNDISTVKCKDGIPLRLFFHRIDIDLYIISRRGYYYPGLSKFSKSKDNDPTLEYPDPELIGNTIYRIWRHSYTRLKPN